MGYSVQIIGGGLAGCEAALQLAHRGVSVYLCEMRPQIKTAVHVTSNFAELVCSNSFKSTKAESASGMLKLELADLGSYLYACMLECRVPAGGALAVDREKFSMRVTSLLEEHPLITLVREEVVDFSPSVDAVIVASGPLTSDALASKLSVLTGTEHLAFFDAAAPIVLAESLDYEKLFWQSRYEDNKPGEYLNSSFSKDEYEGFIEALCSAERVIKKEFETNDLFQACQPIEEIARKGVDAPRYGALKPVGLINPQTGNRPWAVLQLRAEDAYASSYNLVGFQTNLTFAEQQRVFRMIPGLEKAEFARYGVMHRNTFLDAPNLLDQGLRLISEQAASLELPLYVAGQLSGTEGYAEAVMSGLYSALSVVAFLNAIELPKMPSDTAFGALLTYATDTCTKNYQPMHVNFGIMPPLSPSVKNKKKRYEAYALRGRKSFEGYCAALKKKNLL